MNGTEKILRVFPSTTKATPDDDLAVTRLPDMFDPYYEEVHVSITFTWDIPMGEMLASAWETRAKKVLLGGPAFGDPGEEFIPGRYLKPGYVITSRGCPNKCWFCSVWKREGKLRELEVKEGHIIQDDNFLACSREHQKKVFEMLSRQKHRPQFTGGLEAARFTRWHSHEFSKLNPEQVFFAYDNEEKYEALIEAGRNLSYHFRGGTKKFRCYVLCGYPKDTPTLAQERMVKTVRAGFWPCAMLYRPPEGIRRVADKTWHDFVFVWSNMAAMNNEVKKIAGGDVRWR